MPFNIFIIHFSVIRVVLIPVIRLTHTRFTPIAFNDDREETEAPSFISDDCQSLLSISPERETDLPVLKISKHLITTVKEQSKYMIATIRTNLLFFITKNPFNQLF